MREQRVGGLVVADGAEREDASATNDAAARVGGHGPAEQLADLVFRGPSRAAEHAGHLGAIETHHAACSVPERSGSGSSANSSSPGGWVTGAIAAAVSSIRASRRAADADIGLPARACSAQARAVSIRPETKPHGCSALGGHGLVLQLLVGVFDREDEAAGGIGVELELECRHECGQRGFETDQLHGECLDLRDRRLGSNRVAMQADRRKHEVGVVRGAGPGILTQQSLGVACRVRFATRCALDQHERLQGPGILDLPQVAVQRRTGGVQVAQGPLGKTRA